MVDINVDWNAEQGDLTSENADLRRKLGDIMRI